MRIAIVGYGGMGRMIEAEARSRGIHDISTIDPKVQGAEFKEINAKSMAGIDVAIDFTHPSAAVQNIRKYCEFKVDAVMGTTGWYDKIEEVRKLVLDSGTRFLWSSNFSIGVNIYFKIIDAASTLINYAEDYDVWGYEIHHHNKADSPSGTAKTLSGMMLKNIERKNKVCYEMLNRKIGKDELHFASVRGGSANFEHTIGFDSDADCITIKHAARNRSGYAAGAVLAAIWLNKKKPGFYGLDDFMQGVIPLKIRFEVGDKDV